GSLGAFREARGSEPRLKRVAADFIDHFQTRLDAMDGKAMIVCMSREICARLYQEIIKLNPEWHHADPAKGSIKIVMTGSVQRQAIAPTACLLAPDQERNPGETVQGPERPVQGSDSTGYVADRFRRAVPAHHVCG